MHDSKLPEARRLRPSACRSGRCRRIPSILEALPEAVEGDRISFGDLVDAFESRSFGPLIVIFAAPNILPVALPGISAVLGAPLILLTAQLMLGWHRPWLPRLPAPPVAGARRLRGPGAAGSCRGCAGSSG